MVRRLDEQGRNAEADEKMLKALELNPDSWEVNKEAGRLRRLRGDIAGAIAFYEKAVEIVESDFHAWALLLTFYQAQGDRENVLRSARMMVSEGEKALEQDPSNGTALGIMAGGFAALGEADRAREWIERAMLIDPDNLMMRYNFACVMVAHLGDNDGALKLMERALALGSETVLKMAETDPDFDLMRNDERFQRILESNAKRLRGTKAVPVIPTAGAEAQPRS
jgi:adenylate cyclase